MERNESFVYSANTYLIKNTDYYNIFRIAVSLIGKMVFLKNFTELRNNKI